MVETGSGLYPAVGCLICNVKPLVG